MRKILGLLFFLLFCSCITKIFSFGGGYDSAQITIRFLDFFNQKTPSSLSKNNSWNGDWIFRRERLALIDQELESLKPDLFIMQQIMSRKGSPSESDVNILSSSALSGYQTKLDSLKEYEDTHEVESLGVAVSLPIRLAASGMASERRFFPLGADGYFSIFAVDLEDNLIAVIDLKMPSSRDQNPSTYDFVRREIVKYVRQVPVCSKRIIVAGNFNDDPNSPRFNDFMESLQLKDTATGFCNINSHCYTATPANEIFLATAGQSMTARVDRILVNIDTYVFSANTSFQKVAESEYAKNFGISKLWPSQKFGWSTSVRLPRCSKSEMGAL